MRKLFLATFMFVAAMVSASGSAHAAAPVKISSLKINGVPVYGGDSQSAKLPVECVALEGMNLVRPLGYNTVTKVGTIVCTHLLDSASPVLFQGMMNNFQVDATFTFVRTSAAGTPQNFYTIKVNDARIVAIRNSSPSSLDSSTASQPAIEVVEFSFADFTVTSVTGATAFSGTATPQ
jgi:type VI protein secretion system component Hcp